jgi:hypothetical protein
VSKVATSVVCRPSLPAKPAGQVCRPSLPAKSAGQVCRPSLPAKSAGQVCRSSLPVKSAGQFCRPSPSWPKLAQKFTCAAERILYLAIKTICNICPGNFLMIVMCPYNHLQLLLFGDKNKKVSHERPQWDQQKNIKTYSSEAM